MDIKKWVTDKGLKDTLLIGSRTKPIYLEDLLKEFKDEQKQVNVALGDVSNNEVAVCKNDDCNSESIVEFIGRNKRQCQVCGEFWKTDC